MKAKKNAEIVNVSAPNKSARKGGPRTALGKTRSKGNALKHGIFTKHVLLQGESQEELDELLLGLRQHFEPIGALEEGFVDELADIWWRRRRVLIAELNEVEMSRVFLKWDERKRQMEETDKLPRTGNPIGSLRRIGSGEALQGALSQLADWKNTIENDGIDLERDVTILETLYGTFGPPPDSLDFCSTYISYALTANVTDDIRKQKGYPSPEECKTALLSDLEDEILRVESLEAERSAMESKRLELESLRQIVPSSPRLDQTIRYEAHLNRAFNQTLENLLDTQRRRRGQPETPRIKVKLS